MSIIRNGGLGKKQGSSEQGRQGRQGRQGGQGGIIKPVSPLSFPSSSSKLSLVHAPCPIPNAQFDFFHRTPLELGIKPARRESISTASRVALAKALNVASMM